jgi:SAM-dependent methyltransferase
VSAPPRQPPGTMDWSLGHYETTAKQLLPAARVVVEQAAPDRDELVVDVGCGTGNAALLAAERGARVTGIDPAARLLDVARARASARGLEATFVQGDAAAIPVQDRSTDLVLSVFGVIFAPDASAAAAEMARVTAPGGRIVVSAWIPRGAISDMVGVSREAMARAVGASAGPAPFAWYERDALTDIFAPLGFSVSVREEQLAFTADSARDFLEAESADHPLWVAGRAVLEPRGELQALQARVLGILEAANEEPGAFRVTSRYVVARAERT